MASPVSDYLRRHFQHFNAREVIQAADAYTALIDDGGAMMVTLAGAMSTGELGKSLAEMIRQDKVHAISCTGANLEESVFNLIGHQQYEPLPDYHDLTPEDEMALRKEGKNRVTDTAIPDEEVVHPVADPLLERWQQAERAGESKFPHEYLYEMLLDGTWKGQEQSDPKDCWLLAAAERDLPIVVPGWEDSTLGNAFCSALLRGDLTHPNIVRNGVEYMAALAGWYAATDKERKIGFFQIGGGIAGDFPICVVPLLQLELDRKDIRLWQYFCQITDAEVSYGGYSGALPNEKITWGKLDVETPKFAIKSDASIVAPLLFALVLGQ